MSESEVCNRKCAMCGNWTRGTEGVVCDLCAEVMNKSLNLTRKDSTMNCNPCEYEETMKASKAGEMIGVPQKCVGCDKFPEPVRKDSKMDGKLIFKVGCPNCGQEVGVTIDFPKPPEQSGMTSMTVKRGMGFSEALEALCRGEKVRREGWGRDFPYLKKLTDETIMMAYGKYSSEKKKYDYTGWNSWIPVPADFVMDDWVIVDGKQSGMTFMEAVEAMKDSEKVRRPSWNGNLSLKIRYRSDVKQHVIVYHDNSRWDPWISDATATDWEIVK